MDREDIDFVTLPPTLVASLQPVVKIISSSPGWLTPTIAVLGLVLALISLGWQVAMFYWSGSRVRLQTKLGLFVAPDVAEPVFPGEQLLAEIRKARVGDLRTLAPTVVVHNRGRLAVTVQSCTWHTQAASMGTRGGALGDMLPHRLEPHARLIAALQPANVTALFQASGTVPDDGWWAIWPVIELGNGKTVRGESLRASSDKWGRDHPCN